MTTIKHCAPFVHPGQQLLKEKPLPNFVEFACQ